MKVTPPQPPKVHSEAKKELRRRRTTELGPKKMYWIQLTAFNLIHVHNRSLFVAIGCLMAALRAVLLIRRRVHELVKLAGIGHLTGRREEKEEPGIRGGRRGGKEGEQTVSCCAPADKMQLRIASETQTATSSALTLHLLHVLGNTACAEHLHTFLAEQKRQPHSQVTPTPRTGDIQATATCPAARILLCWQKTRQLTLILMIHPSSMADLFTSEGSSATATHSHAPSSKAKHPTVFPKRT